MLQTQGITLGGTIALTRFGGAGRGAKVSSSLGCRGLGGKGVQQWTGEVSGRGESGGPALGLGWQRGAVCALRLMSRVTLDASPNLSGP